MKKLLLALSFLAAIHSASAAQQSQTDPRTAPGYCQNFSQQIDASLKKIARERADGIGDNSAPRETNRLLSINNALLEILINQQAAIQLRCPLETRPVSQLDYLSPALDCSTAQLRGDKNPPSCDATTWKKLDLSPSK